MVITFLCAMALLGFCPSSDSRSEGIKWLWYEPTVVELAGKFIVKPYYGPSSFGESPNTGERISVPILLLSRPVNVRGDPRSEINTESVEGVTQLQLVFTKTSPAHEQFIGSTVLVKGTLFRAHTGHHYTNVLVTVQGIRKQRGPSDASQSNSPPTMQLTVKHNGHEVSPPTEVILSIHGRSIPLSVTKGVFLIPREILKTRAGVKVGFQAEVEGDEILTNVGAQDFVDGEQWTLILEDNDFGPRFSRLLSKDAPAASGCAILFEPKTGDGIEMFDPRCRTAGLMPHSQLAPQTKITFQPRSLDMLVDTVDGMFLGGSGYQASNGKVVAVYSRGFASKIELADYLKKKLQTTKTIINRAPVRNEKGEIIGERIVAVIFIKMEALAERFQPLDVTEPTPILCTVLITTKGTNYMELSAEYSDESLETILAFEKYLAAQR